MTDVAKLARAVELIANSAHALSRLAPVDAAALALAAGRLLGLAAKRHRLLAGAEQAAARAEVAAWFLRRQDIFAGRPPPTQRDDILAAAIDLPGIPRGYIELGRPPEWPLKEGRPRKLPDKLATGGL